MFPAENVEDVETHESEAAPAPQAAPLTALERLGHVLLMLCDHDAMPPDMLAEANAGLEHPPRQLVAAALEKLFAEAKAEATDIALDG